MLPGSLAAAPDVPCTVRRLWQADADSLTRCPNYWVPREVVEADVARCRTVAEEAVCHLFRTCLRGRLPKGGWEGAELWVQSYQAGRGLAFQRVGAGKRGGCYVRLEGRHVGGRCCHGCVQVDPGAEPGVCVCGWVMP